MTDDEARLLREAAEELRRVADGQERLAAQLERGADERHRELMRAIGDVLLALEKIERSQYG